MHTKRIFAYIGISCISLLYSACTLPPLAHRTANKNVPARFDYSPDSTNVAQVKWKEFFTDPYLINLIDTALKNNQDLNVVLQDINVAQNEIRARKAAYLPFMQVGAWGGLEKTPRYTRSGAVDEVTEIAPGKLIPNPLPDYTLAAQFSWEVDIWKRLRNSRKAAVYKYLSTIGGKNFMVTKLIAEIANSYFELMALDNQVEILKRNLDIQTNALEIVKLEKQAARVTELAVRRFEAEVLKNQSRVYYVEQRIVEMENKINFLVGRSPRLIFRNSQTFLELPIDTIHAGLPSQLLENRPDIKQAELDLEAAKLDLNVAKTYFYPQLNISAAVGLEAFNPAYLISKSGSTFYNLMGGLVAPLVNRNAIKATYYSANSKQVQAVYSYERTVLNAYVEVANQLSNIRNLAKSFSLKSRQVQALTESIEVSTTLFRSARADYMEVLLTQRDALESKFELIETKKQQLNARVNVYQALGGGWN